jgi:hypothetical protein
MSNDEFERKKLIYNKKIKKKELKSDSGHDTKITSIEKQTQKKITK